jgi:hypothetical protein
MKSEEFGYRDLGFAQIREGLTELRKGDDVNLKAHYLTLKQKFLVETEKTREEF